MNMFLDETSTLDTSYTASGLQFVIRLCTPNEYVHTGQAHANVCKLQKKGDYSMSSHSDVCFQKKILKICFCTFILISENHITNN